MGSANTGIAATLAYVEARDDDPTGETQLAEQVLTYLKGIGVLDSRGKSAGADVVLLADRAAGTGTVWRHGKRIGTFQLERLGEPDADPEQS